MDTTFTVTFCGSCALVPHTDGTRVRVLIPDGSKGWIASDGRTPVPPHQAYMKFPMTSLVATSPRQPDLVYFDGKEKLGICLLNGEVLQVPTAKKKGVTLNALKPANAMTPSAADQSSLHWVARMDRICSNASLAPAYLTKNPEDAKPPVRLAAMLDVKTGTFETKFVRNEIVTDFTPAREKKPEAYSQSLASEISLSTKLDAATVKITSSNEPDLELAADANSKIDLEIGNEVLDDILMPAQSEVRQRDFDFEILFRLTKASPKDIHVPVDRDPKSNTKRGRKADCHLVMFEPQTFV